MEDIDEIAEIVLLNFKWIYQYGKYIYIKQNEKKYIIVDDNLKILKILVFFISSDLQVNSSVQGNLPR